MLSRGETIDLAERLLCARPDTFGRDTDRHCFGPLALRWLAGELAIGGRAVTVGGGRSAVLAAAVAADHVIVSHERSHFEAIRIWCDQAGLDMATTQFVHDPHGTWAPDVDGPEIDIVTLDGDQRFPAPIIAWHRLAPRIAVGGMLVLADTTRRPAAVLADYLHTGTDAWRRTLDATGVAAFVRTASGELGENRGRWARRRPTFDQVLMSLKARRSLRPRGG